MHEHDSESRGRAYRAWNWPLALLLLAFLSMGLLYSLVVPIFEAPDEDTHFAYARYLAETGRLPVQDPTDPGPWLQEGSQPPLYYAIVALVIQGIDTGDVEALQWNNPQNVMGHPAVPGNKNRFIHTERERFPYRGAVLAVHLARLVSLLMGTGTVWLSYLVARQIFADQPTMALAAAAFVAFLPQFLFISAAVNNDNAVILLSTATLYCLLRLLQEAGEQESRGETGEDSPLLPPISLSAAESAPSAPVLRLGVILGLALLSKLSALLLLPFVVLVLALAAWRRRSTPWFLAVTLIVVGVAALLAGWWFLRNVQLYGDPMGTQVMMEIAGRRSFKLERFLAGAWDEFRGLRWSFWALFGWFSLPLDPPVYLVLDVLTLLAGLGLIAVLRESGAARRARGLLRRDLPLLTLVLWLLVVSGGLVWWAAYAKGAQGRLLFPAIAPIAVLFVAGLRTWLPKRTVIVTPILVALPLLAFATWCLWGVIQPAYARPPLIDPSQVPSDAAQPEVTFGERIHLLGVTIDPTTVAPGGTATLTFYWQALEPVMRDALLNIRLFGHDLALLINEDTYPGWGTYPPVLWPVGPVIVDRYRFDLPADADNPTLVRVAARFIDVETGRRWPASDARGQPVLSPTFVANFTLRNLHGSGPAGQPIAHWDDGIVLLSYRVSPTVVYGGESMTVILEWGVEAVPTTDYTVFAHLVNADGRVVAQADGPPRGGDYPTHMWLPGDRVLDQKVIDVPPETLAGEYRLAVGMYRPQTRKRLPVYDANGLRRPDDALQLPISLRVEP